MPDSSAYLAGFTWREPNIQAECCDFLAGGEPTIDQFSGPSLWDGIQDQLNGLFFRTGRQPKPALTIVSSDLQKMRFMHVNSLRHAWLLPRAYSRRSARCPDTDTATLYSERECLGQLDPYICRRTGDLSWLTPQPSRQRLGLF
ncbi:hypothetical protein [Bradyrhizobium sp. BR 1432]|uniref:hypothetical protein n=1 Tax=Bradyrhizobium sp. BR 1432 TaxID=3447966 RepID=UPI003EE55B75